MLRKRVITVLTFNDGVLFRTKLFMNPFVEELIEEFRSSIKLPGFKFRADA